MLQLVAQYQLIDGAVADAFLRQRLGAAQAHFAQVDPCLGRIQQLDLASDGTGSLKRVVQFGQIGPQQLKAAVAVGQPQVLVRCDVRKIPDERTHDW